jgi:hypothetical protein
MKSTRKIFNNFYLIKPDEVYIQNYEGKPSTIYVQKSKTENSEAKVAIVNNQSGRLKLNSLITPEEYVELTNPKNTDLELRDLRRDPQTGVMNEKSILKYVT